MDHQQQLAMFEGMSYEVECAFHPVVTGHVGTNAELLAQVFRLHVSLGSTVADVTYGRGAMWAKLDHGQYRLLKSDILTGVDFRELPYDFQSVDVLILDPPYAHGGQTMKASINDCYCNQNGNHESVVKLYEDGLREGVRVLRKGGLALVKCQDEIESGKQRFTHVEVMHLLESLGFEVVDLFVLVQLSQPTMRLKYQKSARKNHSYLLVGRRRK
jgi:tRNA G10  N-methylase Trm11